MKGINIQDLIHAYESQYDHKVLHIHKMKKDHIFLIETTHEKYVLKLFTDLALLRWQERFLDQLMEKSTKGIIPFIKNRHQTSVNTLPTTSNVFGIMPFIPGETMNQTNWKQVKDCIKLLGHFHVNGTGIYGKQQAIPFRSHLFEKWTTRLESFRRSFHPYQTDNKSELNKHRALSTLLHHYSKETIQWAEWSLQHFPKAYLLYREEQAQWERQIAHLDVAPHNFLLLEDKYYYVLDYDLVDYAPPLYDLIQFINRILNEYNWSYDHLEDLLLTYDSCSQLQAVERDILPILLVYPNDMFREWLGLWRNQEGYHPKKVYQYFEEVERKWDNRRKFVHKCMSMIK